MRAGDVEVVIVDNQLPPHPLAARMRRWPGISLRRWGQNRGFARAVNEGCRLSQGEWLLLLNPDISVSAGFLDGVVHLTGRLQAEAPRAGIVGFGLRSLDGTHQHSVGPFPTLLPMLARLFLPRRRRKYFLRRLEKPRPVPWVTGCCLLVRRSCLEDLGGLDRDFFLYYEDIDLCRRAHAQGWSVHYEPSLEAVHHAPLHDRTVPPYLRLLTRHALLTYAHKHWPWWQFRLLAEIVECEARIRRHWARDAEAASLFARLRRITADLACGRPRAARKRLEQVVRDQEQRRAG
jgi:GT2 family glycosyltransferase